MAAVICNESDLSEAESGARTLQEEFFRNGEIKSAYIKNDGRRLELLSRSVNLPIEFDVSVTDKTKLHSANLRYRDIFYKFSIGAMARRIESMSEQSFIHIDALCDAEFQTSLKRYLDRQMNPAPLFRRHDIEFVDSKESPLVQIADLVAGSIGQYCFERESEIRPAIRKILNAKMRLNSWPSDVLVDREPSSGVFDARISRYSIDSAETFLERSPEEDEDKGLYYIQQLVVQELILVMLTEPDACLTASTLREKLNLSMTPEAFRMQIMAKVRDGNVLLLGSNNGYKLAATESDITEYLDHTLATVKPWLQRVRSAMDRIRSATGNEYRPLDADQKYEIFKEYG